MKICKDGRIHGRINTDYHDPEYIRKQRESYLGNKNSNWKGGITPPKSSVKKGHNPNSIGSPFKKGEFVGSKNPNYKGGITPLQTLIRNLSEYKGWQHSVFVRDGYSCVECHKIGGNLNAHHIKLNHSAKL